MMVVSRLVSLNYILIASCACLFFLCSSFYPQPDQATQDQADQQALGRFFGIPSDLELVSYDGYPPQVGFGQREGLDISAVYRFDDAQEEEFIQQATSAGWQPLPVPEDVRLRIEAFEAGGIKVKVPWRAQTGIFSCKTAGNNVMYAEETIPCSAVDNLGDIVIGVLDTDSNRLFVAVRAAY
ncbi:MAG: hypothetical protein JW918_00190 [Anaerolineae bacterium]|nr:hypothetical protein [Anaerolineae bacterium]